MAAAGAPATLARQRLVALSRDVGPGDLQGVYPFRAGCSEEFELGPVRRRQSDHRNYWRALLGLRSGIFGVGFHRR